jgi:menaquinone-dependent protoporphyrinogen oxidase
MNKAFIKSKQSVEIFSIDGLEKRCRKNFNLSDKIIIASSIRYGKHHPSIIQLVQENFELLNLKITAFVSVNLAPESQKKQSRTHRLFPSSP